MTRAITGLIAAFAMLAGESAMAVTCNSAAAVNNWSAVATWSCGHVPANGDDVVIVAGGTTTLDVSSNSLNSLTVDGTLTIGNSAVARALIVTGNITVAAAATISVGATAATHTLAAGGNIANAGTINLMPAANRLCNVTFNKNGAQTVSGAGAYTFSLITLNMGATNANILDMQSPMTVPSPFLTITNGTYKHDNASNITPWTADPAIPATGGFWLNSAATVTTAGFNLTINGGTLRISSGTMNIGNADTTVLVLGNFATTLFQMDAGTLTVTGGINSSAVAGAGTFTMNGGVITLQSIDAGAVYTVLLGSATTLNWAAGTIIAVNGNNTTDDVDIRSAVQNVTGGTLQMGSAATTSTNDISLINGAGGTLTLGNLVLASGPARNELMRSPTNVLGSLTIGALNNLNPNAGLAITVGVGANSGIWTNNGTFTQGTTTVTFGGTGVASSIGGTAATTFNNLTLNKAANNVAINTTPTIAGTLTFTSGDLVTGANRVILGAAATIATPSAASYVQGTIQKTYNAGAALSYFAGNDFPVGDAASYTPVNISAGTTTTAGSLSVSTLTPDHPQITTPIASTVIDANNDVNRYWRMNNAGLTIGTAISATFTFVAGDLDPTANTANFIVQRYDGANWNPTTLVAANPLNTQASNITTLIAGNNDFAVGDPLAGLLGVPGRFNGFETSTGANALIGRIYTKLAGTAFSLDIVSVNAGKTAYGGAVNNVTVQLLDSRNNTAALDANGCRATWIAVQTITAALNIPASGRITLGGITVPQAYRDARLQISAAGPIIGCSTDRFSIRPTAFSSITSNMNNSGTAGAPSLKTGQNFTITAATGLAGYDNGSGATLASPSLIPLIDNTQVVGSPNAGTIGGVFGAASGGSAAGAGFFYSEVGNFGLNANAIYDNVFTAVDQSTNDCVAGSLSNGLAGGQYGCNFGSPAIALASGFGRFMPDNFNAVANAPTFATFCGAAQATSFTYVGQPFSYASVPVLTVTARNGTSNGLANATTKNYAGAYVKFSNAAGVSLNQAPYNSQAGRYSRFDALGGGATPALDTSGLPATTADPTIGAFANGVGALSFSSGTGLKFVRTTPNLPFNADIALALNVVDGDGIAFAGNPAAFGTVPVASGTGVAFNNGNQFFFGRLRLRSAAGGNRVTLLVPADVQYWSAGTNTGWATNGLDQCTSILNTDIQMLNWRGTIAPNPCRTSTTAASITSNNGIFNVFMAAPGGTFTGSVKLGINLNSVAGNTCAAVGASQIAATNSAKPWLQGAWGGATYTQDPTAIVGFGVNTNTNQFIFQRENY